MIISIPSGKTDGAVAANAYDTKGTAARPIQLVMMIQRCPTLES
jgi:hypothetical protein